MELSNIEHKMVTQYKFKQISKIKNGQATKGYQEWQIILNF